MTQKTIAFDERGQAAKVAGWFSWRHKTRDAHDAARSRYLSAHGKAHRQGVAAASVPAPHDRTKAHRLGRCGCEVPA